jgi:hypothetical protein
MGVQILGPVSQYPSAEADELSRLFANPRKAFKRQNTFRNFAEFMACALARAKALETLKEHVDNVPETADPVRFVDRWIIFDSGFVMPVLGGTYSDEYVWPANPECPAYVPVLKRADCGQKNAWRISWGATIEEAKRNVTSHFSEKLNNTIREGRNPNNALRTAPA